MQIYRYTHPHTHKHTPHRMVPVTSPFTAFLGGSSQGLWASPSLCLSTSVFKMDGDLESCLHEAYSPTSMLGLGLPHPASFPSSFSGSPAGLPRTLVLPVTLNSCSSWPEVGAARTGTEEKVHEARPLGTEGCQGEGEKRRERRVKGRRLRKKGKRDGEKEGRK